MVLIFAIASAAASAVAAFNKLPAPTKQAVVLAITQSTTVLIALTTAVQWVMQGLQGMTRLSLPPTPGWPGQGQTIRVGSPASVQAA